MGLTHIRIRPAMVVPVVQLRLLNSGDSHACQYKNTFLEVLGFYFPFLRCLGCCAGGNPR